jgi:hypothetical protein
MKEAIVSYFIERELISNHFFDNSRNIWGY